LITRLTELAPLLDGWAYFQLETPTMKHALVVLAALILGMSTAAYADPDPALSGLLRSLLRARQWLNTQPLWTEDL
jgi:hypothetical protein